VKALNRMTALGMPASRHPWESLERHLPRTRMRELYFGVAYLAEGWRDS